MYNLKETARVVRTRYPLRGTQLLEQADPCTTSKRPLVLSALDILSVEPARLPEQADPCTTSMRHIAVIMNSLTAYGETEPTNVLNRKPFPRTPCTRRTLPASRVTGIAGQPCFAQ
eukprot:7846670-Pyramimonas_sp.AAC.1